MQKINVVNIKSSKYTDDELRYAVKKSNFIVTGIGKTLNFAIIEDKPVLVDVNSDKLEKTYPKNVDYFDPYRNEETKPYYTTKDLELLLKEVYNQLNKHRIDYVNFL